MRDELKRRGPAAGRVSVESALGEGATLAICVPVAARRA
jgi:hypothetical protein